MPTSGASLKDGEGRAMKKYVLAAVVVLGVPLLVLMLGPRPEVDVTQRPEPVTGDVESYLAQAEAQFTDIRPGAEKTVVWANPVTREKTELAVVYLHGFSATRQETRPFSDSIAAWLGANLFYTRLSGHGRSDDAMREATATRWIRDGYEALEVGRRLGDKIVLIGTSTGATLATWLAAQEDARDIMALVLISPNFRLKDTDARLLLWPWGATLARLIVGPYYQWEPHNEAHARYWTTRYPSAALVDMMSLVDLVEHTDLRRVEAPVLVFYSPEDQIVSAEKIEERFPEFGADYKQLVPVETSDDPSHHVLAGAILSPSTTMPLAEAAFTFIQPMLRKPEPTVLE